MSAQGWRVSVQNARNEAQQRFEYRRPQPPGPAMANPLSNTGKFSTPGETVEVGVASAGTMARVWVRGKGPGISDEFKDRIFQKFAQADSSDTKLRGGTGLGISISKLIVESFGGGIGFESEPGKGSVFPFELPLCVRGKISENEDSSARETLGEPGEPHVRRRILHVEDDADVRDVVAMVLKDTAEVSQAGTLARARELIAANRYDLILLDIMLQTVRALISWTRSVTLRL